MISVVIPAYNRKDCLIELLACLGCQSTAAKEIIVVDDCSTDDTVATVRAQFPDVVLVCNSVNRGPAVSRNIGVRRATGEIIVGFDSDVTITDSQLLEKVTDEFAARPEITGLAFRLFEPDGRSEDVARWWHPLPVDFYAQKEFLTDYFSGTAYSFRKEDMERAGLFPEILYMHYEEVELAFRVVDNGGNILYCPNLTAIHHANKVSRRSEIRVFYKPRNQVLIVLRCYTFLRGIQYIVPRLGYGLITAILNGSLKRFLDAMLSAGRLSRRCLQERRPLKEATWQKIASLSQTPAQPGPSVVQQSGVGVL